MRLKPNYERKIMDKTKIIQTLRDMAKHPTVTLPRDTDALKSAADLLERECFYCGGKDGDHGSRCPTHEPVSQLMDMIVGNLVREGINKHRARELAEHFIKQCNYTNGYCTGRTDLLKEQAEQKPVATLWQHGETGRTRITMPGDITDCDARWFKVSDLYTSPPPRKPWVGLTADEVWQSDEVMALNAEMGLPMNQIMALIVWANAKLKEKNT